MAPADARRQLVLGLWVLASAVQVASLRAGERHGVRPASAGEKGARSVAVCLVGEARVIGCKPVLDNILSTMYNPIAKEADVFVALKVDSTLYGAARCLSGDPQAAVRNLVQANFRPVAIKFRGEEPIIPECEKPGKGMDGMKCKPAFLLGVPCLDMVAEYEREHRGGKRYDYLMHLRGDLVYRYSLPPVSEWPVPGSTQLLFAEGCCGDTPDKKTGRCPREKTHGEGELGCIGDTWGIMSRGTADIYYQRNWDFNYHSDVARKKTGLPCSLTHLFECLRGCIMHYNDVDVYRIMMNAKILHTDMPSGPDSEIIGEVVLRDDTGQPRGKRRKENTTQGTKPLTANPEDLFNLEGL